MSPPGPVGPESARRIGFARHGEATWTGLRYAGRTDLPLTEAGRAAATALAERVATCGLLADPAAVIVSSPLVRCLDTARAVAEATGRPVETDPRWVEADFGAAEGCAFEEVAHRWPAIVARMTAGDIAIDWPDGETWAALRDRVSAALDAVLARDVPVLVVSHGIAIHAALATLLASVGESDPLPWLHPAAMVVVRRDVGRWALDGPR